MERLPFLRTRDTDDDAPEPPVTPARWGLRLAMWLAFVAWGTALCGLDVATGAIGDTFLHRPLLVFHEAGHVLCRPFGEWMTVFGGTLGQLAMPLLMAAGLAWRGRDLFGASLATWLAGVSLLDVAAYAYDALHPQLTLLSGGTGDDSFHDWIWLLDEAGRRAQAQAIGHGLHLAGVVVVAGSLAWGAALLVGQARRMEVDDAR